MKEIGIEELLKLQVDILQKVDKFCRDNSINYTVFCGTCIGAIRHKGYIPWDDDIDIAMTRPNYNRFINTFNGMVEDLEVFAPELNWNYYAPYANVCDTRTILDEGTNGHRGMEIGVKIDVFPIDAVATSLEDYHNVKKKLAWNWKMMYAKRVLLKRMWKTNKKDFLVLLIKRLISLNKSYATIQKDIYKMLIEHPYEEAVYVDLLCYPWPTDSRCSKKIFDFYTDVQFENIKVSIIKEYNEYLTKAYGNYMQLPPKEKQVPHHSFTAYWKD